MGKLIDETGNQYGRWTVISRAENNHKNQAQWLCRCGCGTERVVSGINLRAGLSQSCGCLQRDRASECSINELRGQRFGRLTVIERSGTDKQGGVVWLCMCDCGKQNNVTGKNLLSGNTRSCGCLSYEIRRLPEGEASRNAIINRMKHDAIRRNLSWELSDTFVQELITQPCYYCGGSPSQIAGNHGGRNGTFIYNGIDRIDSSIGYVPDNTVPCCKRCNYAKHEMNVQEFKDWVRRVYEHFVQ